jgi:ribosomal protein L37E
MGFFYKEVDLQNEKDMIDFLKNHFRYYTMNSWNRSTSYANNVKIYNLQLGELEDKVYKLMNAEDFYSNIDDLIYEFGRAHNWSWQVGFNGRNGGYLVLYQGGKKQSEYKSYCTACGQRNYTLIEENSDKCGRCGLNARVNYKNIPVEHFSYPGKSTDMDEDFEQWDICSLIKRVNLVQDFDKLADDILAEVIDMAKNFEVEEETYYETKTRTVIRESMK